MIQTLSILAALRESGATVGLPTSGFPRSPSSVGENGKAWGGHQKPIEIPRRPCYKPCAMRKLRGTRASGLNRLGPRELRFELRVDFVARAGSLPRLFQVVGRRLRHARDGRRFAEWEVGLGMFAVFVIIMGTYVAGMLWFITRAHQQ